MDDKLLSKLTGIPIQQINRYSPQQRAQLVQMLQKTNLPKIDTTKADELLQKRTTSSINGLISRYGLSDAIKTPRPTKPKHTPRELTDEEIQAEVALTRQLNPTYQYQHFASIKDPNRVGVIVTNPVTGERAEYARSFVDMNGNDIANPQWEYVGNGTLKEGQSWRKVAGNMTVNGRQVDSSNKPIHSSETSYAYPHKETKETKETKSEKPVLQPRQTSSVTATVSREAAKYPGNKNGYVADRAQGSDAFLNTVDKIWNKVKQGASAAWDYLDGPEEKIQPTVPSGPRRNIFTVGMKKIHGTFGNAYKPTPGSYGGGQFGGGGAGSTFYERPEYEEIKEKKQLLVPITTSRNRDEAFAQARKEGKKTFWFNGKEYTTEMGTGPASAAHDVESKTVLVPLEYTKNRKVKKKD